jgi:hypothetical protein
MITQRKIILRKIINPNEIIAISVSGFNKYLAKETAELMAKEKGGFIAPSYLLLENFPHNIMYTANSEDISGFGEFQGKKDYYVVTLHGGQDGNGVLTYDVALAARDTPNGFNRVHAVRFSAVFGNKPVLNDLLQGGMPDGTTIPLVSWEQFANEGSPVEEFKRYAIVTPLDVAIKAQSSDYSVSESTYYASRLYRTERIDGKEHIVAINSQLIRYAGGQQKANAFLTRLVKDLRWKGFGVNHPFGLKEFDKDEAQGRMILVAEDDSGVYGYHDIRFDNSFAVVVPPNFELEQRNMFVAPTLEQILAVHNSRGLGQEQKEKEYRQLYQRKN